MAAANAMHVARAARGVEAAHPATAKRAAAVDMAIDASVYSAAQAINSAATSTTTTNTATAAATAAAAVCAGRWEHASH
jgi:hypothetical protein